VTDRITKERLVELRVSTPHATVEDIGTAGGAPEALEDLAVYLNHYAKPKPKKEGWFGEAPPCLVCDAVNSFEWGLVHGEGRCAECGWPATLYHFIKDRNGNDLATIRGVLLQYHPDSIEIREPT
jgi:hypothetical protein